MKHSNKLIPLILTVLLLLPAVLTGCDDGDSLAPATATATAETAAATATAAPTEDTGPISLEEAEAVIQKYYDLKPWAEVGTYSIFSRLGIESMFSGTSHTILSDGRRSSGVSYAD